LLVALDNIKKRHNDGELPRKKAAADRTYTTKSGVKIRVIEDPAGADIPADYFPVPEMAVNQGSQAEDTGPGPLDGLYARDQSLQIPDEALRGLRIPRISLF
jgi:hypothetical protein